MGALRRGGGFYCFGGFLLFTGRGYLRNSKFETRLCYGIFMGYMMTPGIKWSGICKVIDISEFVGKNLHQLAPHEDFKRCIHFMLASTVTQRLCRGT